LKTKKDGYFFWEEVVTAETLRPFIETIRPLIVISLNSKKKGQKKMENLMKLTDEEMKFVLNQNAVDEILSHDHVGSVFTQFESYLRIKSF